MNEIEKSILRSGYGMPDKALTDLLGGIDHRSTGTPFYRPQDFQGFCFFVRPDLNLSYNNLMMNPKLMSYATQERNSLYRAARALLDPRGGARRLGEFNFTDANLINNRSPFIDVFTNTVKTVSGLPDIVLDTFVSQEGIRREEWSMVDSVAEFNKAFTVEVSFDNIFGDFLTIILELWINYMSDLYEGACIAAPSNIFQDRIDYQTRLIRIKTDTTKRFVTGIAATGPMYPLNLVTGTDFAFNSERSLHDEYETVTYSFQAQQFTARDPRLIYYFNELTFIYNKELRNICQLWFNSPEMFNKMNYSYDFVLLTQDVIDEYNKKRCYPVININTLEIGWWMRKSDLRGVY